MSVELTEEQKQVEREKAQQYAELMQVPYVDPFPPEAKVDEPPVPSKELTDAELLEMVNKRSGIVLSSFDDLKPKPTAEALAAAEQERHSEMLAFGLKSGKFKKEDYDAYQQAQGNKMAVVKTELTEKFTALFPELAPEAIEEKVANYVFEHLDPEDAIRKTREKELISLFDVNIQNKYKNIVDLPKDYAQYEEGVNKQVNFEKKVQATLPVYKADVSRALEGLRNFTVEVPDSKNPEKSVNVPLEYSDTDLKEVAEMLTTNDQIIKAVKEGYTPETLKEIADFVLWKKHGPRLISQAAKKYNAIQKDGYMMARKGLNAQDAIVVNTDNDKEKTDLDAIYDELKASAPTK